MRALHVALTAMRSAFFAKKHKIPIILIIFFQEIIRKAYLCIIQKTGGI